MSLLLLSLRDKLSTKEIEIEIEPARKSGNSIQTKASLQRVQMRAKTQTTTARFGHKHFFNQ